MFNGLITLRGMAGSGKSIWVPFSNCFSIRSMPIIKEKKYKVTLWRSFSCPLKFLRINSIYQISNIHRSYFFWINWFLLLFLKKKSIQRSLKSGGIVLGAFKSIILHPLSHLKVCLVVVYVAALRLRCMLRAALLLATVAGCPASRTGPN